MFWEEGRGVEGEGWEIGKELMRCAGKGEEGWVTIML